MYQASIFGLDEFAVYYHVFAACLIIDTMTLPSFQFEFAVHRGNNGQGYVSLDDIKFYGWEDCVLQPPNAEPTTTTKTPTTTPPTTTIEPTEPPDRMLIDYSPKSIKFLESLFSKASKFLIV